MGSALGLGLALGGVSAATSFLGQAAQASQQRNQMNAQAAAQEAQAAEYRRQSEMARQRGDVEAANIERRKSGLRRQFNELQAANRARLGAGNVDMSSGSALAISEGNINRFAMDLGENAYEKAMKEWESNESVKSLKYQADTADAQASYLWQSATAMRPNLLTSLLSGASGFVSGYSLAGGRFFSDTAASAAKTGIWDKATASGLYMRHPSGKIAFVPR